MLIFPLNALPWNITGIINALVSKKRIEIFLKTDEI